MTRSIFDTLNAANFSSIAALTAAGVGRGGAPEYPGRVGTLTDSGVVQKNLSWIPSSAAAVRAAFSPIGPPCSTSTTLPPLSRNALSTSLATGTSVGAGGVGPGPDARTVGRGA